MDRKDDLLKIIVEEYIASANPVGSGLIVDKYFKDLSSATIRNDMAELEKNGYICQPHTSAGRIPTVLGYQKYLTDFIGDGEITETEKTVLAEINQDDQRQTAKEVAKAIAEFSNNAAFVGFNANDYYYTGISNLFRQPEFLERAYLYSMSDIIDHMDEAISRVMKNLAIGERKTLIGENNPFGELSTAVIAGYKNQDQLGVIGILGPNRMNYKQCLGLVDYTEKILSSI